jgi:hypothetical protein
MNYYQKYLKYKRKYLRRKNKYVQNGGHIPDFNIPFKYVDGKNYNNLYHILINLQLVAEGLRPGYMFNENNYSPQECISKLVYNTLTASSGSGLLFEMTYLVPGQQMLIIRKNKKQFNDSNMAKYDELTKLIERYRKSKDAAEQRKILGSILGNKCETVDVTASDVVIINLNVTGGLELFSMTCKKTEEAAIMKYYSEIINWYNDRRKLLPGWNDLPDLAIHKFP